MSTIFTVALLVFVAISVVWSVFVRKLLKTRIKSILVIASVLVALIGTIIIKDSVLDPAFAEGTLLPMLLPYIPAQFADFVNNSTALREVALGLPVAFLSPIVFAILCTVLNILTSIAYFFVILFAGRKLRKSDKNREPYAKARGFLWATCSAVLSLLVILVPLAFYGSLVDDTLAAISESEMLPAETQEMVANINKEYVAPITQGTVVEAFRALGGDMLINEMTSFPLKGEVVIVRDEFGAISGLVGDIMSLVEAGVPTNYGEEEVDAVVSIVDSLSNSKFLVAIASEAVYTLTDDMVTGEASMPLADNEMFGGLISRAITIIHDDTKDTKLFVADLKTVAEMAGELVKGGVLSNISDTDALMEELAGGSTIKNVILTLGKNNSMKCLIPEVTNIGISAIASFVEVKDDANTAYNEMLAAIAYDLNSVKALEGDVQAEELAAKLADTFDHAGVAIKKEEADLYAAAMILEIASMSGEAAVTADNVQAFFATNTSVNVVALQNAEAYEEITLLVFLDELAIDVDEAAKLITDETVEQEAEAIGGIFSQAGTLLNDVSGEINIGTMAESVGGILNSLNNSVCVGQERTSKLFIAIVQSGVVRDAANMDIATATELGTKGSTGENIDYAKTFKTISNTMDVLQNMNSSTEGGMSAEDLTVVLKDLNQQTAGMIESYITEDRLANDYGLNEEQSTTVAPLISDVFGYMGNADMTEEECAKEAEAITDVMNLVTSASDKANSSSSETSQPVFGGEESILGKDANGTVETFMASESIKHSLNNNAENLEDDTFGMQDMMAEEEKEDLKSAMSDYYTNTEYETEDAREKDAEALTNLGKLFGFTTEEINGILGK